MAKQLDKKAALGAGNLYDRTADMTMALAKAGHLKPEIARKFAYQCDLLSDHFAKAAGIDITKMAASRKQALDGDDVFNESTLGFNPEEIGEETAGPNEQETDEAYMDDHFSQQENRELRETVEDNDLGPDKTKDERQTPKPGVQAALAQGQKLAALYLDINQAATRCAASKDAGVQALGTKLASAGLDVLQFQTRLLEGSENGDRLTALTKAAAHVMPHLANDVPPAAAEKLARMVGIFSGLAKAV